ncbi:MAG: HTH-type transcriptional regulator PrtR [Syntrophus sp. PtaB.Bin138]|nr:MAG: HTH-type transcriptional regulator PrtR [Syntrophus sp. PtaB.Bin138]
MDIILPSIGQRIQFALDRANLKQKDLADRLGVKPTTVSGYISGKIDASVKVIQLVSQMTGVTLDWLITGEGPMRNESVEISGYAIRAEPNGSAPTDEEMEDLPKPFIEVIKEGYKLTLSNQYRIAADMLDKIGELIAEEERKKRKEEGDK